MNKEGATRYSPKIGECGVRMALVHRGEHPSLWLAIESIAPEIGCVLKTLNEWVRNYQVDNDERLGNAGNPAKESLHSNCTE